MIITAVCCRFPQTYIISLYSPIDWLSYPFNVFFLSSVTTIRKNLMIRQLRSYIPILVSKYNLFNIFILFFCIQTSTRIISFRGKVSGPKELF